jgi:hypothetical protein
LIRRLKTCGYKIFKIWSAIDWLAKTSGFACGFAVTVFARNEIS